MYIIWLRRISMILGLTMSCQFNPFILSNPDLTKWYASQSSLYTSFTKFTRSRFFTPSSIYTCVNVLHGSWCALYISVALQCAILFSIYRNLECVIVANKYWIIFTSFRVVYISPSSMFFHWYSIDIDHHRELYSISWTHHLRYH